MDAQLKKGVLELCLLQCLSGEPKYGYDVIQTMRARFPEVTESSLLYHSFCKRTTCPSVENCRLRPDAQALHDLPELPPVLRHPLQPLPST